MSWPPGAVNPEHPHSPANVRGVPIWGFVLAGVCLVLMIGVTIAIPVLQHRADVREEHRRIGATCREMATRVLPDHRIGDDVWLDAYAECITRLSD